MGTDRREFLVRAAWMAGSAMLPIWGEGALARPTFGTHPFTLGVASGDPLPDSVVIWTRLAPQPLADDGGMLPEPVAVRWEMAEDENFAKIIRQGEAVARPQSAHSVHVEVEGLKPDRVYYYRFHAGSETSQTGRTRTSPVATADIQHLRYAFTACQRYENGYYAGYRQMVADDPALVLFLGDYIYEQKARDGLPRRHPEEVARDLPSYRRRHAVYKLDKDLQAAHAAAPWMVIWDDHEVKNNYGGDTPPEGMAVEKYLRQRAASYQAYYEHMPLRRRSIPVGPAMRLYRSLDWGRLVQFQFLDGRQYRDAPPCADGASGGKVCLTREDQARSMLGAEQEKWLMDLLGNSRAQWNVLAQQFMMVDTLRRDPDTGALSHGLDGWDGYPAARERILTRWRDAKVANPIAIGGDSHAFIASELSVGRDGPVIAPAFVGGSLSSTGKSREEFDELVRDNPRIRFGESVLRGYTLVNVDKRESLVEMKATADATDPNTTTSTLKRFVVEDGVPGFRDA